MRLSTEIQCDTPDGYPAMERTPEQKALDIMQVTFDSYKPRYYTMSEPDKGKVWLSVINQAVGYLTNGSPGCSKTAYEAMLVVKNLIDHINMGGSK